VTARCPHLFHICRTRGLAAKPALELLISNPLDLRVPVVPSLDKWGLEPLVLYAHLSRVRLFRALGLGCLRVSLTW
jgi:hypothetical protein